MSSNAYVVDPEPHEVAAAQFAIDREIEEGKVTAMVFELEPDPYCPDLLRFERALLADEAPLVPGHLRKTNH